MNAWKVIYAVRAEQDLRDIYEYIAFSLYAPDIAKNQVKRIMDAVASLDQMPMRFRLYENEPWHSKGLRILPIDNYIAFYLPVESRKTVAVIRIMYGERDTEKQLNQEL